MSRTILISTSLLAGVSLLAFTGQGIAREALVNMPAPAIIEPPSQARETALIAGGCFWGVQEVFRHVKGVERVTSGYAGGGASTAHYANVATGRTGHAEAVKIIFDPSVVNFADLLQVYFSVVADPTQVNRQGPDVGPQYRSALFPQTPAQAKVAQAYIAQLSAAHVYARPIVTKLEKQQGFFPAEDYHQNFMARNPDHPYILVNDRPKVEALRVLFPQRWRP